MGTRNVQGLLQKAKDGKRGEIVSQQMIGQPQCGHKADINPHLIKNELKNHNKLEEKMRNSKNVFKRQK